MTAPTEDERRIIDDAIQQITSSFNSMLGEMWNIWSDLGLDNETIVNQVHALTRGDAFQNALNETRERIDELNSDIEKLKLEITELCKSLSIDFALPEYSEAMKLVDYKMELESIAIGFREQLEHQKNKKQQN